MINRFPSSVISHFFGPRIPITTAQGTTSDFHSGIDIVLSEWTPLLSWREGTVEWISSAGGLGNHVLIEHIGNYHSLYAHLVELPNIVVGQYIKHDMIIGHVGNTGMSLGAHLHFEIWHHRRAIDPINFFKDFIG